MHVDSQERAKSQIVLLPATAPDDKRYGVMPERIAACPDASVHHVHFPTLVWYNRAVRRQAMAEIASLDADQMVLVGFSKSGLGAWNITRAMPRRIAATIIFDAPVARTEQPPWGTDPFYADDAAWLEDLPLHHLAEYHAAVPDSHRLILISGRNFHAEMTVLSQALVNTGIKHLFLPRPHLEHHWQSGWIEEGLHTLLDADTCRACT